MGMRRKWSDTSNTQFWVKDIFSYVVLLVCYQGSVRSIRAFVIACSDKDDCTWFVSTDLRLRFFVVAVNVYQCVDSICVEVLLRAPRTISATTLISVQSNCAVNSSVTNIFVRYVTLFLDNHSSKTLERTEYGVCLNCCGIGLVFRKCICSNLHQALYIVYLGRLE